MAQVLKDLNSAKSYSMRPKERVKRAGSQYRDERPAQPFPTIIALAPAEDATPNAAASSESTDATNPPAVIKHKHTAA